MMMRRKQAKPWTAVGMPYDDPEKEIQEFFTLVDRQAKNCLRYISLLQRAYESYDRNLDARFIEKKTQDLVHHLEALTKLGDFFVKKSIDLDEIALMHQHHEGDNRHYAGSDTYRPRPTRAKDAGRHSLLRLAAQHPHLRKHVQAILPLI